MSSRANSMYLTGVKAGADLTAEQYTVVELDAAGDVIQADAGDLPIGVLMNAPADGEAADVVFHGGAMVIAAGNIDEGAFVKPNDDGHVVATTTDNDFYIGRAIRSAVDNDIVEIIVQPGFYGAGA